ncbi:MAG: DUF1573 domain-containing protein [Saprospiraceae bacterium]|nr:DUF1573 domain-containing protein [Saprospiraceae bacterium]
MLKFLYLILPLLFVLPGNNSGVKSKVEWLDATTHDYGKLERLQPAKTIFRFKNISSQPLTIDNVRTSCGCTAPAWPATPIEPDSIGTIEIEYDAHKKGYFQKRIKVYFSGQRKAEKLYIKGEVLP